jgi:hypothetical protein
VLCLDSSGARLHNVGSLNIASRVVTVNVRDDNKVATTPTAVQICLTIESCADNSNNKP